MRPSLHTKFVDKAEAALVAAVEVYNKPSFQYREETFAILAINAWELLLKARLLKDANNTLKAIRVYESRKTKAGKPSKKQYLKRNRAGTPLTISLVACITRLDKQSDARLHPEIKANLAALTAVRDGATHYINASPVLTKHVHEVAAATVKNFILLARQWFKRDFSNSLSLVMPLAFLSGASEISSVVVTAGEKRLIEYLQGLADTETDAKSPFSVAVSVKIKFERSKLTTASKVQVTKDPDAVRVVLTEEDMRERYPWDYRVLTNRMKARYSDFKENNRYHALRKPLLSDKRYAHSRLLDPSKPKGTRKDFYSPSIFNKFDEHYTRK